MQCSSFWLLCTVLGAIAAFKHVKQDLGCTLFLRDQDADIVDVRFNYIAGRAPKLPSSRDLGGIRASLSLRGLSSSDWLQTGAVKVSSSEVCATHKAWEWCLLAAVAQHGDPANADEGDAILWGGKSPINISYALDMPTRRWRQTILDDVAGKIKSQVTSTKSRMTMLTIAIDYYGAYTGFVPLQNYTNVVITVTKPHVSWAFIGKAGCLIQGLKQSNNPLMWTIDALTYQP